MLTESNKIDAAERDKNVNTYFGSVFPYFYFFPCWGTMSAISFDLCRKNKLNKPRLCCTLIISQPATRGHCQEVLVERIPAPPELSLAALLLLCGAAHLKPFPLGLGWMIVSGRPESVFWLIIKKNNWIFIELVKSCCSIMTVVWVQSSPFVFLSCSNCCWNNRTSSGSAVRVLCRDQLKIEWIVRGVTLIYWSVHNKRENIPP